MTEIFITLFTALVFFLGLSMLTRGLRLFVLNKNASKWPKVQGKVTHFLTDNQTHLITDSVALDKTNTLKLAYEFSYQGYVYKSNQLLVGTKKNDVITKGTNYFFGGIYYEDLSLFLSLIKDKPDVNVWVNPEKPQISVLHVNPAKNLINAGFGLPFLVWGIILLKVLGFIPPIDLSSKIQVVAIKTQEEMQETIIDNKEEESE